MARKIRLTRPELKRQRDALERFERYLPMLQLKQQQLQLTILDLRRRRREAHAEAEKVRKRIDRYRPLLQDPAGINVTKLASPTEVHTGEENVAGVRIPTFESVSFGAADYSLFATPPWVDKALADNRELNEKQERAEIIDRGYELLNRALTKVIQRVNLFDKVLIPRCRENIRIIRIRLGEEQTAAVGRAKLAKGKLESRRHAAGSAFATAVRPNSPQAVMESKP
ncbi:MAG: V-type ATP synthase subunit D [Planctomycetota bacterium]|nr:V-type ATP synthase subunit D [Planctomycetota bacterium]